MTLDQAANYADIFSALALIGGIEFGLIQLPEYSKQRREVIAAELMLTSYTVEQLAGGMVVMLWRTLDLWVAAVRDQQSQPTWAEWFQWLAELSAPRKSSTQPAHLKHKGWTP